MYVPLTYAHTQPYILVDRRNDGESVISVDQRSTKSMSVSSCGHDRSCANRSPHHVFIIACLSSSGLAMMTSRPSSHKLSNACPNRAQRRPLCPRLHPMISMQTIVVLTITSMSSQALNRTSRNRSPNRPHRKTRPHLLLLLPFPLLPLTHRPSWCTHMSPRKYYPPLLHSPLETRAQRSRWSSLSSPRQQHPMKANSSLHSGARSPLRTTVAAIATTT